MGARYREINDWERFLTDNGIKVVKLLLNLSKEEQRSVLQAARLARPELEVLRRRPPGAGVLGRLRESFSEMLWHTSTEWAPWYVIPADRKWFARICAAAVLAHTLIQIDPHYPEVSAKAAS